MKITSQNLKITFEKVKILPFFLSQNIDNQLFIQKLGKKLIFFCNAYIEAKIYILMECIFLPYIYYIIDIQYIIYRKKVEN